MRAGSLDRLITIEQAAVFVSDAGTPSKSWTLFATMRAQVLQFSTDDRETSRGNVTDQTVTFRIRWLEGVTLEHRAVYEGQPFTINKVKPIGRRVGLDLICERVGP